jgi:hypothetical protein
VIKTIYLKYKKNKINNKKIKKKKIKIKNKMRNNNKIRISHYNKKIIIIHKIK